MGKKNIVFLSDWNLTKDGEPQSGYSQIAVEICTKLEQDYNIIAVGPSYRRGFHRFNFSLTNVPFQLFPSALNSIKNTVPISGLVVCLDIPMQRQILKTEARKGIKYAGIFAVEADPLYSPWAMDLSLMDHRFAISEFGANECNRVGVETKHFTVPTDRTIWREKTPEEQLAIKDALGVKEKTVFFVNADGNERKNTSMILEAFKELIHVRNIKDVYLFILTQKDSPVNWNLEELITRFKLNKNASVLNRGISAEEVRRLYVASDFFLNVTKAEGMSYPILEAMSVGTPVIATNATAMKDHLDGGKNGIPVEPDFVHIDIFGNTNRYYVFPQNLANVIHNQLVSLKENPSVLDGMIKNAKEYIDRRNTVESVNLLRNIFNE